MGSKKIRNNKRNKIEARHSEQKIKQKETNIFELKLNKIKHQVLGRKVAKNEVGKPLLNRSRSIHKREQTLLKEYKNKHKTGKGLRDLREDIEKRVVSKYKEAPSNAEPGDFEDVQLTHKGQLLEENFDDQLSSDEDEDVDIFRRDNYVEDAHFGGGQNGTPLSTREVMNDIISEKFAKKEEKEKTVKLTQQLDDQWAEVKSILRHKGATLDVKSETRDEYDNIFTQLVFDSKNNDVPKPVMPHDYPKAVALTENDSSSTPDSVFKTKLQLIETTSNTETIWKILKDVISLLTRITRKSHDFLYESLIKLTETPLKFTISQTALLVIASYFKELKVIVHLLIMKTLKKIKYSTYQDVAASIFLCKFLLKTLNNQDLYPILFVHVENLSALMLPTEKVKIRLSNHLNSTRSCILNVFNSVEKGMTRNGLYNVSLKTLFQKTFTDVGENETVVAFNLALQVIELASDIREKYSNLPAVQQLTRIIFNNLRSIQSDNDHFNQCLAKLISQYSSQTPTTVMVNIRPKPFILPMLEPRIETSLSKRAHQDVNKRAAHKYKREFKGAQREIRKDSIFMRNTQLNEIEKRDKVRKQKVKVLLRDLSIQQGLFKKSK